MLTSGFQLPRAAWERSVTNHSAMAGWFSCLFVGNRVIDTTERPWEAEAHSPPAVLTWEGETRFVVLSICWLQRVSWKLQDLKVPLTLKKMSCFGHSSCFCRLYHVLFALETFYTQCIPICCAISLVWFIWSKEKSLFFLYFYTALRFLLLLILL